ncbi:MAG: hypothetical protein ACLTW9_20615 [Enterocloster sp.]
MYSESNLFSLFSSVGIVTLNLTKAITKEEATRKKRFLLGAVALTAALAATGCGGTNGSQAADSAKTQADTGKDSGSQDSGNKDSGGQGHQQSRRGRQEHLLHPDPGHLGRGGCQNL